MQTWDHVFGYSVVAMHNRIPGMKQRAEQSYMVRICARSMGYANENVLNWIEQITYNALSGGRRNHVQKQFCMPLSDGRGIQSKKYISQLVSQRHPHPYSMRCVQSKRSNKGSALTTGTFLCESVEVRELTPFIVACFRSQYTSKAR